jgi:hypothetical protein
MFFSRPIQWYHSHADPIWPDGTFHLSSEDEESSYTDQPERLQCDEETLSNDYKVKMAYFERRHEYYSLLC